LQACEALAAERSPAPLHWSQREVPWRAALLRVDRFPPPSSPGEPHDAIGLALSVTAPLQAHADVRDLEYDDV
jgi:hypothetical protein